MGQLCFITNWDSLFITNGEGVIAKWGSYCKLGQLLLHIGAAIINRDNLYYKLGQLLQVGA